MTRAVPAGIGAVACLAVVAWLLRPDSGEDPGAAQESATGEDAAVSASREFLDSYMDSDGRVVRRDQGGDTVSEGQSYAMLLAVALGDAERFELAWGWARDNLQRSDGLLASHWAGGTVDDPSPAADADLDAAHAMLLAAERFDEPSYRREALQIGAGVLADETVRTRGGAVLAAGPWARESSTVNPSYFAPAAYGALGGASGDPRWSQLERTSRALAGELTAASPHLPPDWARLEEGGASAIGPPDDPDSKPVYGYDAVRAPVRLAQSCEPADRALAARASPFLSRVSREGEVGAVYALDGRAVDSGTHPAALVGAAAAADAAGDGKAAGELLDRAEAANDAAPSYYGTAWLALGRVTLTTDLLGAC